MKPRSAASRHGAVFSVVSREQCERRSGRSHHRFTTKRIAANTTNFSRRITVHGTHLFVGHLIEVLIALFQERIEPIHESLQFAFFPIEIAEQSLALDRCRPILLALHIRNFLFQPTL